jgi:hypothetical protein
MPSTEASWSSMVNACIARTRPMPSTSRLGRPSTWVVLPRVTPPLSVQRKRTSRTWAARAAAIARSAAVSAGPGRAELVAMSTSVVRLGQRRQPQASHKTERPGGRDRMYRHSSDERTEV